jgi:hypothetical protein
MMLTAERLREVLSYSPETGLFYWREQRGSVRSGARAGHVDSDRYIRIGVDAAVYKAHRLAWLYVHGNWPADFIDHINGDPGDNRITNLRACCHAQNLKNVRRNRKNSSGFKGVYSRTGGRTWYSQIVSDGRRRHLGSFPSKEKAAAAYDEAARRLHGEFARTNGVG